MTYLHMTTHTYSPIVWDPLEFACKTVNARPFTPKSHCSRHVLLIIWNGCFPMDNSERSVNFLLSISCLGCFFFEESAPRGVSTRHLLIFYFLFYLPILFKWKAVLKWERLDQAWLDNGTWIWHFTIPLVFEPGFCPFRGANLHPLKNTSLSWEARASLGFH